MRKVTKPSAIGEKGIAPISLRVSERITVRPEQMSGVPCVRGLRLPVATVVGMTAEGMTDSETPRLRKRRVGSSDLSHVPRSAWRT